MKFSNCDWSIFVAACARFGPAPLNDNRRIQGAQRLAHRVARVYSADRQTRRPLTEQRSRSYAGNISNVRLETEHSNYLMGCHPTQEETLVTRALGEDRRLL